MSRVYHMSFNEKHMPHGLRFGETNKIMHNLGVEVSTNYRKGSPQFGSSYLVLFMQDGKPYFSRVDKRHYDAFEVFNDGKEMRECSCYPEFERRVREFVEKGYCECEEN